MQICLHPYIAFIEICKFNLQSSASAKRVSQEREIMDYWIHICPASIKIEYSTPIDLKRTRLKSLMHMFELLFSSFSKAL